MPDSPAAESLPHRIVAALRRREFGGYSRDRAVHFFPNFQSIEIIERHNLRGPLGAAAKLLLGRTDIDAGFAGHIETEATFGAENLFTNL